MAAQISWTPNGYFTSCHMSKLTRKAGFIHYLGGGPLIYSHVFKGVPAGPCGSDTWLSGRQKKSSSNSFTKALINIREMNLVAANHSRSSCTAWMKTRTSVAVTPCACSYQVGLQVGLQEFVPAATFVSSTISLSILVTTCRLGNIIRFFFSLKLSAKSPHLLQLVSFWTHFRHALLRASVFREFRFNRSVSRHFDGRAHSHVEFHESASATDPDQVS